MRIRYSREHLTDTTAKNHSLCKVNDWRNEWFTVKSVESRIDAAKEFMTLKIRGMKNRYFYYNEEQGPEFILHLLRDPETDVVGLFDLIKDHPDTFHESVYGVPNNTNKKDDPYKGVATNNKCGTFKSMKRRLIEAAYYSLIGFNMLLMCAVLVGISFAYRIGNHEANPQPIRW
jgi:hypothetical protein